MPRSRKREILPLPANLTPDGRVCFCINIPDDAEHFAAFWGALQALGHRYSWGKPLTPQSETIASFWREIIADNRACFEEVLAMANRGCGCGSEPIFRYSSSGIRQVSRDDGVTWTDDLTDPRQYGSVIPPPLWYVPAADNSCPAAITGANNMKALLDQLIADAPTALTALVTALSTLICIYTSGVGCALAEIIGGICATLAQIGFAVLGQEMTPEVYHHFQCILVCRIGDDATFTSGQWDGVKSDISEQMTGDPEFVLWNLVNLMGAVGLTNLCRASVLASGNCDDCPCDCSQISLGLYGETLVKRTDLGVGWWQVNLTLEAIENCETFGCWFAEILVPSCCRLTDYSFNPSGANTPLGHRQATDCANNTDYGNYLLSGTVKNILFRGTASAVVTFRLVEP